MERYGKIAVGAWYDRRPTVMLKGRPLVWRCGGGYRRTTLAKVFLFTSVDCLGDGVGPLKVLNISAPGETAGQEKLSDIPTA